MFYLLQHSNISPNSFFLFFPVFQNQASENCQGGKRKVSFLYVFVSVGTLPLSVIYLFLLFTCLKKIIRESLRN